jgi:CRISPR system Cascade subunit CasE
MTTPLHIVRLVLDRRAILRVGVRHRLGQSVDDGALLHAGLSQLFASSADPVRLPLHTFAVDDVRAASLHQPERLFVLAYSRMDGQSLTTLMGPASNDLLIRCESREMPALQRGQRLGFRTRVCPVVRTKKPGSRSLRQDATGRVIAREVDAFVHATLGLPLAIRVDRAEVYERWFRDRVEKQGACAADQIDLAEFHRETMRRGAARIERPDTVLEGTLVVVDPDEFRKLLVRGVGRHRAYGFGMILLRPLVR